MRKRTNTLFLFHLPCGDVMEFDQLRLGSEIIECPWCDAVYDEGELCEYVGNSPHPFMQLMRPLVTDGTRLLEVVGMCSDGHPIVREKRRGAYPEHSDSILLALRN